MICKVLCDLIGDTEQQEGVKVIKQEIAMSIHGAEHVISLLIADSEGK